MYIYMDMVFTSPSDVPDFGSIQMYFTGTKEEGYVEADNKKFRKYSFLSIDKSKLNNITNALDGSQALAVDTGDIYILYNNQWVEKAGSAFKVQMVNQLPVSGKKGTLYLLGSSHEGAENTYNEYVWVNNSFEQIGDAYINLNYIPKVANKTGKIPQFNSSGDIEDSGVQASSLLTTTDIVVCTQNEYDNMQTRTGLLYFIVEGGGS